MLIRPDNRAGPLGANPIQPKPPRRLGLPDLPPGRTPAGLPAPQDPLAALLAAYPHPETDAQLQSHAQGMIDPLVQALTDGINRRATAGAGAIRGYTQQEMADLGKYADSAKSIYGGAQQSQAASDSALADRLQGNGAGLAAGLADRLKGIGNGNDPAVAAAAADQTTTGQGSGNALYGKGSASLADLIARGAGAQEYASKLPGIASLGGAQSLRDLEMSAQNDIASGADQIQSKIPDLIASLRAGNDQKQANLAAARAGLYQWQTGRQDTKDQNAANMRERAVLAKMAAETDATKAAQDWRKFQTSENDRNQRATDAEAGRNARTQAQIDAANARAAAAAAGKTAATGHGVKPPTSNEINTWVDAWKNGKPTTTTVQAPKPDANGNPVYRNVTQKTGKLSYIQAYQRLRALNVPDQQARSYLDTAWKRGEQGRGWLTNEEQHALQQAKLPPRAYRYKGVGYIDPKQANALKAAGIQMPPGHWIQGSTATQDLGPVYVIEQTY